MKTKRPIRWGFISKGMLIVSAVVGIIAGAVDRKHSEQVMNETIQTEVSKQLKNLNAGNG